LYRGVRAAVFAVQKRSNSENRNCNGTQKQQQPDVYYTDLALRSSSVSVDQGRSKEVEWCEMPLMQLGMYEGTAFASPDNG
jgi:hypothetical protein